ncbi:MAG TPA: RICIN domain-containing protein, partial [Haloferula sp.]
PSNIWGRHTIVGMNNMAIDTLGLTANNSIVGLWGLGPSQNQLWNFSQNSDGSWNIVSQSSWKSLDVPGGNPANNTKIIQWPPTRGSNQRLWVDQQSDGTYRIWNQQSGASLDSSSTTTNGTQLIQWGWSGGQQQRWRLQ